MNNPIIQEIREARAALAEEHGFDRAEIISWARAKQAELKLANPNTAHLPTRDSPQSFSEPQAASK